MSLPKISVPTFEIEQPSTKKKVVFRPFLVKEEKILLMAKESNDRSDMLRAIKQIIQNCIQDDNINVNKLPLYDLEYFFIHLRAKSIDNNVDFEVVDSDDQQTYSFKLNLDEVQVIFPDEEVSNIIKVNDQFSIRMFHPTAEISDHIKDINNLTELTFELIMNCIECIFDEENVYDWSKASRKEREEFIDMFDHDTFAQIKKFLDSSPKIEHIVTYENSLNMKKKVVFRNLDDFFMFY